MHVLLIEDNPDDAALVREYLKESPAFDCRLTHVSDLGSALSSCDREPYDAILLDLSLPDSHGLDTLRRMQSVSEVIPTVVLTGLDDEQIGLTAVREGAQDYLTKGDLNGRVLVRALRYAMERQRTRSELNQAEEQLLQAQKMEVIGLLAGGVAHDFNNLLTVIVGYSDLLLDQLVDEEPVRNSIKEIKRAGDRGATLTRQLLAFSRQQILEPKVLDLNAVVRESDRLLRRLIGEDILLTLQLEPDLCHIKADPGQLEQVIMNLAVNARDAMPTGGSLRIETSNIELDQSYALTHPEIRVGPYVLMTVGDTGCGMDAATQTRIFEPFFTTKGHGKGSGLGLATVFGIVKQSGGHVWVYSELGHGTIFKVYLPRAESPVTVETSTAAPARPISTGTETILLVEDDEAVRGIAVLVLTNSNYTVLPAGTPQEAIRICETHPRPIHLLISDVIMPEMGGRQVADAILTLRPNIKVLYMSGYTDDAVVRHGISHEQVAFLQKPFSPNALAGKVRQVLSQ